MGTLLQDLRFGLRTLGRSPGFTAVVVLSLAVGIGANTTTFSWIESMLLHPISGAARAEELVSLQTIKPSGEPILTSYPDYRDYRDRSTLLAGVTAFHGLPLTLGDSQQAEPVWAESVTGKFFDVLGVKPALGRTFLPEEAAEKLGAFPVVVISHDLWRRRFHSDPGVVGRRILLNRQPFTVVGVGPRDFYGAFVGVSWDLFVPLTMEEQLTGSRNRLTARTWRDLQVFARLAPGVSRERAAAEIQSLSRGLAQTHPESNEGLRATLWPVWRAPFTGSAILGPLLQILMGASGVVLLIVCANVANLLLAHAADRQKELSIRLGLGASRIRLVRQLLTESLLLALLGAAGGFLLAHWLIGSLLALTPVTYFRLHLAARLDGAVLGFTLLLAVLAAVLFGLAPALQATRSGLLVLREGTRASTAGPRSQRLRQLLVVSEVALALVALIGAGLFLRSYRHARQSHPGFDPERVLLAGFNLSSSRYDRSQGLLFYRRLRQRLEALPGVQAVSCARTVPLGFEGQTWEEFGVEGYVPRREDDMKVFDNRVAPGYFDLMKIPLLEGRDFTAQDDERAPPVAIVNRTFVEKYLGGQYAIGRRLRAFDRTLTIVGVAGNGKYERIDERPQPYLYVPLEQFYNPSHRAAMHVRTAGAPESLVAAVRREVRALDPNVAVVSEISLRDYTSATLLTQKAAASLLTVLGILALLVAALGLYGVIAHAVSRRTHEIGIRMALGAERSHVLRLVVGQAAVMLVLGVVAGLAGALVLTRLAAGLLFGVSATDPLAFAGASLFLAAVALLASYLPARRAMNLHPAAALRYE